MMQISSALMVKKKAVANMAMKIGYIQEIDLQLNPQCKERFRFREASVSYTHLRAHETKVEWANTADPHEYDPFA